MKTAKHILHVILYGQAVLCAEATYSHSSTNYSLSGRCFIGDEWLIGIKKLQSGNDVWFKVGQTRGSLQLLNYNPKTQIARFSEGDNFFYVSFPHPNEIDHRDAMNDSRAAPEPSKAIEEPILSLSGEEPRTRKDFSSTTRTNSSRTQTTPHSKDESNETNRTKGGPGVSSSGGNPSTDLGTDPQVEAAPSDLRTDGAESSEYIRSTPVIIKRPRPDSVLILE